MIKSQLDNNFCVQVGNGGAEGRTITLQSCNLVDQQRWAFSNNSDGTNLIIDDVGMCVDGNFRKGEDGFARTVHKCDFDTGSLFVFTALGQIRDVKNNKCLWVAGAAGGAAVSLVDCDETDTNQLWNAGHF